MMMVRGAEWVIRHEVGVSVEAPPSEQCPSCDGLLLAVSFASFVTDADEALLHWQNAISKADPGHRSVARRWSAPFGPNQDGLRGRGSGASEFRFCSVPPVPTASAQASVRGLGGQASIIGPMKGFAMCARSAALSTITAPLTACPYSGIRHSSISQSIILHRIPACAALGASQQASGPSP